jgi:putative phosphoesterase
MVRSSSILVVSDSHGHLPALTAALRWAAGKLPSPGGKGPPPLDAAVFLGDGAEDLEAASAEAGLTLPWYIVRGNGDMNFSIPDTLILEIPVGGETGGASRPGGPVETRRIFLAHGNRHGVDAGPAAIAAAARFAGAEAALFGHTHVPYCGMLEGIFLLNPGSIGRPRSRAGPSFAVLDCPARGPLSARFWGLVQKGRNISVRELE